MKILKLLYNKFLAAFDAFKNPEKYWVDKNPSEYIYQISNLIPGLCYWHEDFGMIAIHRQINTSIIVYSIFNCNGSASDWHEKQQGLLKFNEIRNFSKKCILIPEASVTADNSSIEINDFSVNFVKIKIKELTPNDESLIIANKIIQNICQNIKQNKD